ncbi:Late transcription factor VLTF-4 (1), partial [Monkeypox virus]|jgi:hypothetical protein|eukprot:symbB.v1.2.040563.t1/scaffold7338.1/size11852/1
MA